MTFFHPYNFVSLPPGGLGAANDLAPFFRSLAAAHNHYHPDRYTGQIVCQLSTLTHFFLPDPRKVTERAGHKTLGYFSLDPLVHPWQDYGAANDATRPSIPGSSLRGMIRSVFEAITLSCFSVFDSSRLDFRIGYSPDHDGSQTNASGRGAAHYIPCRVVKCDDEEEEAVIQLLDGRYESAVERPIIVNSVLFRAYQDKVKSGQGPTRDWDAMGDAPDGTPVVAYISRAPKYGRDNRYRYRQAKGILSIAAKNEIPAHGAPAETDGPIIESTVKKIQAWLPSQGSESPDKYLIFGYLHRTGPNWREKKDERICFSANTPYNNPAHPEYIEDLAERLNAFMADTKEQYALSPSVFRECKDALKGYARRGGKKLKPRDARPPRYLNTNENGEFSRKPLPSDFVMRHENDARIQVGDIFYALIEEAHGEVPRRIHGLYPVAIPRLNHENSRGELLSNDFYPCSRCHEKCPRCRDLGSLPEDERVLCSQCQSVTTRLCPACRVFGWTRDLSHFRRSDVARLKASSERVDALASHVRFSHGVLQGEWNVLNRCAVSIPLPVLASPHPTATGFYLQPLGSPEEWNQEKQRRWPPVTGANDPKNPVANLPAYRQSEALLAGRKMYRRQSHTDATRSAQRVGGLKKEPPHSDQNRTVHAVPPELKFGFRVEFDNLTHEELGALLFAIMLDAPRDWKSNDQKLFHTLGYGKPVGMGRCAIQIQSIELHSADRYQSMSFGKNHRTDTPRVYTDAMDAFVNHWNQVAQDPNLRTVRHQIIEMLSELPPDAVVKYPPVETDGTGHNANFEWWSNAKRQGILLPDPSVERSDPDQRLTD